MTSFTRRITRIAAVALIGATAALPMASAFAASNGGTEPAQTYSATAAQQTQTKMAVRDQIMAARRILNAEGHKLRVDGVMGKHTRTALIAYQKQHGLEATGKLDALTLQSLGVRNG